MKHTRLLSQVRVVITINLLLWLAMLSPALCGGTREERAIAIAGVVFAAIAEHWSLYAVRKARRSDESAAERDGISCL